MDLKDIMHIYYKIIVCLNLLFMEMQHILFKKIIGRK